jgi:hypothetical protein
MLFNVISELRQTGFSGKSAVKKWPSSPVTNGATAAPDLKSTGLAQNLGQL